MISGAVSANGVPAILIEIGGKVYRAIIDTGFNSDLELPVELKTRLESKLVGTATFSLAADVIVEEDVYQVDFPFDGRTVRADATFVNGDEILIGAHLLRHYRLTINFVARTVRLQRVSKK